MHSHGARLFLLCCLAAAGVGPLWSQPHPSFRTSTTLVEVDVIARDHTGKSVEDLSPEHLTLKVDGKPRSIAFFSRLTDGSGSGNASLPPNTYSNRAAVRSGAHALNIFLLDVLNTRFEHLAYAEQELAKYFRESVREEDRIFVLAVGLAGIRIVYDFRGDPEAKPGRLAARSGPGDFGSLLAVDLSAAVDLSLAGKSGAQWELQLRITRTIEALESIAFNCRGVPGRKNLIWISEIFPAPWRVEGAVRERAEKVWRTFASQNVAIYPVDARGVQPDMRFDPARGYSDPRDALPGGPSPSLDAANIAQRTGGRVFQNANNLSEAIREAVQDSRTLFMIGFYPPAGQSKDRFHTISLEIQRPGVHLRYRPGYYDSDEELRPTTNVKADKARVAAAVGSLMDAAEVPVWAHVDIAGDGGPLWVTVRTPLDVEPEETTLRYRILFVQRTKEGRQFRGIDDRIELPITPVTYESLVREGVVYKREVRREPQASDLRIVVQRIGSAAIGTVTVPFTTLHLGVTPTVPK